jgi:hypothetical protein
MQSKSARDVLISRSAAELQTGAALTTRFGSRFAHRHVRISNRKLPLEPLNLRQMIWSAWRPA